MKTLVISKEEIPLLLSMKDLIENIKQAYVTYSMKNNIQSQKLSAQIDDTSVVVNMPGYLPESPLITVKINTKVPNNPSVGLPFLTGTILLIDKNNGQLQAIMDSGLITAMRTGAAGAVGVECLANPGANRIAVIGAGIQAEWQIKALHTIGRVDQVYIYDLVESQSRLLSKKLLDELNISSYIASSPQEAIKQSDIAILTTQSRTPIITPDMVHPGLHINAFGADQPGKVELDAEVINQHLVAVDDCKLAFTDGALNVANKNKLLSSSKKYLEIGELICGGFRRSSYDQVTIFANSGLALQDLVACSIVYENALKVGVGHWIDLSGSSSVSDSSEYEKKTENKVSFFKARL